MQKERWSRWLLPTLRAVQHQTCVHSFLGALRVKVNGSEFKTEWGESNWR